MCHLCGRTVEGIVRHKRRQARDGVRPDALGVNPELDCLCSRRHGGAGCKRGGGGVMDGTFLWGERHGTPADVGRSIGEDTGRSGRRTPRATTSPMSWRNTCRMGWGSLTLGLGTADVDHADVLITGLLGLIDGDGGHLLSQVLAQMHPLPPPKTKTKHACR